MSNKDSLGGSKVAILCGGRGSRLRPTTDDVPKALVSLNGCPILDHILDLYRAKGLREFILCVGYKADRVEAHYANAGMEDEIRFSNEGVDASMLERIWALRDLISERLFVTYGDTFTDLNLQAMLDTHLRLGAEVTIVTAKIRSPFGLVAMGQEGFVTSFVEKPLLDYYIGSFILERRAMDHITPELLAKPDGQGLVEFFAALSAQRRLAAYQHEGLQITFNTESERQIAEEHLGEFYTYREDA